MNLEPLNLCEPETVMQHNATLQEAISPVIFKGGLYSSFNAGAPFRLVLLRQGPQRAALRMSFLRPCCECQHVVTGNDWNAISS